MARDKGYGRDERVKPGARCFRADLGLSALLIALHSILGKTVA
jgi:hypothetical protein